MRSGARATRVAVGRQASALHGMVPAAKAAKMCAGGSDGSTPNAGTRRGCGPGRSRRRVACATCWQAVAAHRPSVVRHRAIGVAARSGHRFSRQAARARRCRWPRPHHRVARRERSARTVRAALAAELVQMKLDLIDAGGSAATLAVTFPERGAKGLELLKEAVPGLSRMALLWAPTDLGRGGRPDELRCRSRCTRAARGRLCGQELPQASPLRADRVIA